MGFLKIRCCKYSLISAQGSAVGTVQRKNFTHSKFGFNKGRSCTQAAFIVSESIAECKDRKTPLYIASLDVQKAFDVIRHESLLERLYQFGLSGAWWRLKDSAYTDLRECITWNGELSESFPIKVSFASPSKSALNKVHTKVLNTMSHTHRHCSPWPPNNSSLGFSTGNIVLTCPT